MVLCLKRLNSVENAENIEKPRLHTKYCIYDAPLMDWPYSVYLTIGIGPVLL